jgi:amino acid transporter
MPPSDDVTRLRQLGYEQELRRDLSVMGSVAVGFATISPVVGLYAVVLVGTVLAGPAWVWVLPVCLAGQCLLIAVYAELAAEFPISGGPYQWARRLIGPAYGWFTGWLSIWSYLVANTTIAYLGAPWVCTLFAITPTPNRLVGIAAMSVTLCSIVNAFGVTALRRLLTLGIAAEAIASVLVGLALLFVFRTQSPQVLFETFGAQRLSGGSVAGAMLAALAVGGWAFLGFDACVQTSEETHQAGRTVPKAVWWALLSVGGLVLLNAFAVALAHPDPASIVAGKDPDPVTTAVVDSFGSWSAKPFVVVVLVSFFACGLAAQGASARAMYSMARDRALPWSGFLRRVSGPHQSPIGSTVAVTVVGIAGLLFALNSEAIGSLIAFGTAVIYLVFFLIVLAALIARLRGIWTPAPRTRRDGRQTRPRRLGLATVVNVLAVAWQGFEFVNVAWPRASLAPAGAPIYQVWAAPLVTVAVALAGLAYLLSAAPHRRGPTPPDAIPDTGSGTPVGVSDMPGKVPGLSRRWQRVAGCRSWFT